MQQMEMQLFMQIISILSLVAIFLKMVGTTKIGNIVTQLVSQYSTRDDAGKNTSLIYNSGTDWVIWIVVFCFSISLLYRKPEVYWFR